MNEVRMTVFDNERQVFSAVVTLPLELGRQREADSGVFRVQDLGQLYRIAIAPTDALGLSREAVRVEPVDRQSVRLRNIHRSFPFHLLASGEAVNPGQTAVVNLAEEPSIGLTSGYRVSFAVAVGDGLTGGVVAAQDDDSNLRTMQVSLADLHFDQAHSNLGDLLRDKPGSDPGRLAVSLVNRALEVVQKAAGSNEFFDAAVRSTASMIDLDHAYVLLRKGERWEVRSSFSRQHNRFWSREDSDEEPALPAGSGQLLGRLLRDRRTIVFEPNNFMYTAGSSLLLLDRAVAAPLLDQNQQIIGALYGDRRFGSDTPDAPIGDLEATLLEVMAAAVASGIARQREETARRREESLRSSMNQFFSPGVLERLQQDEHLLSGRDAEVTVLFCDIRGFSAISEREGPQRTIQWINDVLTELSQCVLDTDGVLVDYIGDELMAMWGAPADQPDHAARACHAALEMLRRVEPLRQRWREITPDKFGIGIGINTGEARVGNTGSAVKFKYGPLGNTVNVASRVQGMTKQFGVPALVTESTMKAAAAKGSGGELEYRRIAEVQPLGVQSHLAIHQLAGEPDASWGMLRDRYEQALGAYEQGGLTAAARSLVTLIDSHPDDVPSVMLLQRVVDAIAHGDRPIDKIIRLAHK